MNDKTQKKVKSIVGNISKKESKVIEPHFFTNKELKENTSDPLIKDIVRNGKSLL